jgi:hypothetical protein
LEREIMNVRQGSTEGRKGSEVMKIGKGGHEGRSGSPEIIC